MINIFSFFLINKIRFRNFYISQLVDKLGLKKRSKDLSDYTALYDGSKILFAESAWKAVSVSKLLWRYGLGIYHLNNHISNMLDSFERFGSNFMNNQPNK